MSPVPPAKSSERLDNKSIPETPYTYIGDGEMSEYNDTRRCSLCGVTIHNFRVIKPILRYDPSRPYFHRFGRDRGIKTTTPVGWSCGKHHVIDPDWLPKEVKELSRSAHLTRLVTEDNNCGMTPRERIIENRTTLGLGREKFARLVSRSASTIYKWERGEVPVDEAIVELSDRIIEERGLRRASGNHEHAA